MDSPKELSGLDRDLFTPRCVVERIGEELDEAGEQFAKGIVSRGFDAAAEDSQCLRHRVREVGDAADDAERATTAAPQCPEQIAVLGVVDDANLAVRRHHLHLEHAAGAAAESLREAAEPATEGEATDRPDRGAAAALGVDLVAVATL